MYCRNSPSVPRQELWCGAYSLPKLIMGSSSRFLPWSNIFCLFQDKARCHQSYLRADWYIHFPVLGKLRLAKWFIPMTAKAKAKMVHDITYLVMARRQRTLCSILEYKGERSAYATSAQPYNLSHWQELRCFRISMRESQSCRTDRSSFQGRVPAIRLAVLRVCDRGRR